MAPRPTTASSRGTTTSYGRTAPRRFPREAAPVRRPGRVGPRRSIDHRAQTGDPLPLPGRRRQRRRQQLSDDQSFRTSPLLPQVKEFVTNVHSNEVLLQTQINPGGADTAFTSSTASELLGSPDPCSTRLPATPHRLETGNFDPGSEALRRPQPARPTTTASSRPTRRARPRARPDLLDLPLPRRPERRLSQLPRAPADRGGAGDRLPGYELVSAAQAGGYDVESDLVPGQTPFDRLPAGGGPLQGPLRGPQRRDPGRPRQPDQSGRRPLRRDPGRRLRLDHLIRRDPCQRPIRARRRSRRCRWY